MDLRVILLTASIVMLTACAGEVPPPQPAPPTDRNFTATVNDQPVVGGTASFECLIRSDGKDHQSRYLLTFTDDLAHTIQVGIERGGDAPGARAIVDGMATTTGLAYGRPQGTTATLTAIVPTATGAVISGKFSARFEVANAAPNVVMRDPLIVKDALFEQVECIDPVEAQAAQKP